MWKHSHKKRNSLEATTAFAVFPLFSQIKMKISTTTRTKCTRFSAPDDGDDLDDLFMLIDGVILDGDQVLNQQIESIATEIASNEENLAGFQWNECDKVCKSQRGLTILINFFFSCDYGENYTLLHDASASCCEDLDDLDINDEKVIALAPGIWFLKAVLFLSTFLITFWLTWNFVTSKIYLW